MALGETHNPAADCRSPVLPQAVHPCAHEVIHHVVRRRHATEDLADQGLLLLDRDLLEACGKGPAEVGGGDERRAAEREARDSAAP